MCTACFNFYCISVKNQLHNVTLLVDKVKRSPGCSVNIVRPSPLMSAQEALHPGTLSQKHTVDVVSPAMISQQRAPISPCRFTPNPSCLTFSSLRDSACEELSHRLCFHPLQWSEEIRSLHSGAINGRHACGGLL